MYKVIKLAMVIAIVLMTSQYHAYAQYSGTIQGTVTDQSGAVVTHADITLSSEETGVSQKSQSTSAGFYQFTSLRPGSYTVSIAATGFSTTQQQHIDLGTYESKVVNVELRPASAEVEVNVNASAVQVQLADPKQTFVLSGKELEDMPLEGRNTYATLSEAPGVIANPTILGTGGNNLAVLGFNTASYPYTYTRGMPSYTTQFYLDGSNVTVIYQGGGGSTITPNVESVQSVRVSANDFTTQYNSAGGLVTQVTTKGGTNAVHGSAYEFYSGDKLLSRNTFQNVKSPITGRYIPTFSLNQFGGSVAGPIRKNRTFYAGSFGYYTGGQAVSSIVPVETPELLAFMKQNYPNNLSTKLLTTYPVSVSVLNPGSVQTVAAFSSGCSGTGPLGMPCSMPFIGTVSFSATQPTNGYQYNVRIDQVFSPRDTVFGEFYRTGNLFGIANPRPAFNWTSTTNSTDALGMWTHVFGTKAANQAAVAFTRLHTYFPNCSLCQIPSLVGTTGVNAPGDPGFGGDIQSAYEGRDGVTMTIGAHSLSFGAEFIYSSNHQDHNLSMERPVFTFRTPFDFMADAPFQETFNIDPTTGQVTDFSRTFHAPILGTYVQDEWKLKPNLTLNVGLRWDYEGGVSEEKGRLSNIQLGQGNTLLQQISSASLVRSTPPLASSFKTAFGPRVAIAWDPTGSGKTSIHGAFGLFFDPVPWNALANGSQNLPFTAGVVATTQVPSGPQPKYVLGTTASAPYGFTFPAVQLGVNSHGGLNSGSTSVSSVDPHLKDQYVENVYFGIDHQFGANWIVQLNYLGTFGRDLFVNFNRNRYAGASASGTLVRPNPYFSTINYIDNSNSSNFNGAVVTVRRQLTKGFTVSGNYMWSHAIDLASSFGPTNIPGTVYDAWNLKAQRSNSAINVTHVASLQGLWQLPSLKDQEWLVKSVLGGWQLTGNATLHSGYPFTVFTSATDYNQDGQFNDLPMASPSITKRHLNNHDLRYGGGISASMFSAPPAGQEGNVGRNTFTLAGFEQTDMSLAKNFGVKWLSGDKANLQFRAEATNALNHVNFSDASISTDVSNPTTFGKSTSVSTPRFFQLAARLSF